MMQTYDGICEECYIDVYVEYNALSLNQTFTYRCKYPVQVGCRVTVPFGRQELVAYVVALKETTSLEDVREVLSVLDKKPIMNDELFLLADWMSETYIASKIACLKTMVPPAMRPSSSHSKIVYEDWIDLVDEVVELSEKQKDLIAKNTFPCKASHLRQQSPSMVKTLLKKGAFRVFKKEKEVNILPQVAFQPAPQLNTQQKEAIQTIQESRDSVFLLHGVTGSGKTEVFLHLASEALKKQKQVLILVPEIGLTPMMIQRVLSRFQKKIAIYHSQLSAQEKYNQYRLVAENQVDIVVGTRSAVFMPFSNLGLILMDEEHDWSYKQDNQPRYHTRDVAIWRSRYHRCKLVLASATPSLDSYARAYKKKYHLVSLTHRITVSMPKIHLIDLKKEQVQSGLSQTLLNAIQDRLEKKEQTILLLNRRGYLPVLRCTDCNTVISCPDCDLSLAYHKKENLLMCHCCGRTFAVQTECPHCHGHSFYQSVMGTEKLEENLHSLFPTAHIVRMDADSTRKKHAHEKLLLEFEQKGDILLGTQMVAKGLDFERVTLVGILQADASFARLDFSSNEMGYDLLEQASGRSGRSNKTGEVYIQTFDPDQYVLQCVVSHNYLSFFQQEMQFRHLGGYPPYKYLCTIIYMDTEMERAMEAAMDAKVFLQPLKTLGPVSISMRQRKNRVRLLVKAENAQILTEKIWALVRYQQSKKKKMYPDINMYPLMLED